jgi:hypothetical protein
MDIRTILATRCKCFDVLSNRSGEDEDEDEEVHQRKAAAGQTDQFRKIIFNQNQVCKIQYIYK